MEKIGCNVSSFDGIAFCYCNSSYAIVCGCDSDDYVVGVTLQLKGAIFILEPVGKGSMYRIILTILLKI